MKNTINDFVFKKETGTILGYCGTRKDVVIPAKIDGVTVTSIGRWAFASKYLTRVVIPDSITSIKDRAFVNNQLTRVTIPDSMTFIGNGVFARNQLTSVTIPNSVTFIGDCAFYGNQLTSVTIPDSMTSIGNGVFARNQLTSVTIPDSVTCIRDCAFKGNPLTSVTIPDSVTSIGYGAFASNQLSSVTIPDSVTFIGEQAFGDDVVIKRGEYITSHKGVHMKPLGKNVLIELDQVEESNIIPIGRLERPHTGVVKGVGAKVEYLSEGDKILFADSFSSNPVPDSKDLIVMHEDSIVLIL